MTGNILNFEAMVAARHNRRLRALAEQMSDALSRRLVSEPGFTPQDQLAVQIIALSRNAAVACTTLPGGFEANARGICDVLYHHIIGTQENALHAVTAAYTNRPNKDAQ